MGAPRVKLDIDATGRADINLARGVNADLEALFDQAAEAAQQSLGGQQAC
jgi:hypothetical protein